MARRPRGLTDKERQDWALFARQIKALPGRATSLAELPAPAPEPPREPPPTVHVAKPLPAVKAGPLFVGTNPGGVDNASWNKLRGGKLPVARTLDLHGRTVQRAYQALHHFLVTAHADQVRCVEVITGRGSGENGGAIRREFQLWLNLPALRPLVLAATHPHPANPGSVRLLLRRAK